MKSLSEQINLNNKKKSFSVLMTEHERKVNDNDIKAYENLDKKNLYALVPGFNSYNQQEKYIDKSMKLFNINNIRIGNNKSGSRRSNRAKSGSINNGQLERVKSKNKQILNFGNTVEAISPSQQLNELYYSPQKLQRIQKIWKLLI